MTFPERTMANKNRISAAIMTFLIVLMQIIKRITVCHAFKDISLLDLDWLENRKKA